MTTHTSLSERKAGRSPNRRFFNSAYFSFRLRCGWPLFVTFLVIFILSLIVPGVKYASQLADRNTDVIPMTSAELHSCVIDYMSIIGLLNVAMSMFCGFISGLTALKYVNKKVAVNFYHSLPLRREAHFICSVLPPFVTYLAAFLIGHLVNFAVFTMRVGEANFAILGHSILYGVIFFMLIYSITLAGASLAGTGFMRFVSSMYIMFLPLVAFLLFIGMIAIGNPEFNSDYYISDRLISLCPPARFFRLYNLTEHETLSYLCPIDKNVTVTAVISIVMLAVSFVLYLWRHSESASQPLIWRAARFVFKYSSMFIGGTLFGLIFRAMFESSGWMIFGIITGSLITFMLVNGIINKSARAIFRGVRGLVVYACVMAAVVIVFYVDALGMFSDTPQPSFVKNVTVSIGNYYNLELGGDFAYRATKLIGQTVEQSRGADPDEVCVTDGYLVSEVIDPDDANTDIDLQAIYTSGKTFDTWRLTAEYKTKLGFTLAMRYYVNCDAAAELVSFIEGYAAERGGGFPESSQNITSMEVSALGMSDSHIQLSGDIANTLEYLKSRTVPENPGMAIGCVMFRSESPEEYFSSGSSRTYVYLLYASDAELVEHFFGESSVPDAIEDMKASVKMIYVVSNTTAEYKSFENRSETDEIIDSLYSMWTDYYTRDNVLRCTKDHAYNVFPVFEDEEGTAAKAYYGYSGSLSFRRGDVPGFVVRDLAK